jgi:hypothetical protein
LISILPESFDDLLKCLSVFLLGGVICFFVGRLLRIRDIFSLSLYAWHTVFCFAYAFIAVKNGGDAVGYYMRSFDRFLVFELGTNSIVFVVSFFATTLGFSFIATSLAFNVMGALGLIFFLAALRQAQQGMHWAYWLVMLLPSVSFWSAGLGKDPLSFFASALFAWWIVTGGVKLWPVVLALVVMGLARPHIAIVMAGTGALFAFIQARQSPLRASVGLLLVVAGGIYLLPVVLQKMSLETFDMENIGDVIESRESKNLMGGSSIEISGMPLYLKVFTYLFRPMPFEAVDAFQLLNSFENLILLLVVLGAFGLYIRRMNQRSGWQMFPLMIMSVFLALFLAQITANLGIAVRQKWMALVPLFVVLASGVRIRSAGRTTVSGMRVSRAQTFTQPGRPQ